MAPNVNVETIRRAVNEWADANLSAEQIEGLIFALAMNPHALMALRREVTAQRAELVKDLLPRRV